MSDETTIPPDLVLAPLDMLASCAKQFRLYEDEHAAKGGEAKAAVNGAFAAMCDAAISAARNNTLTVNGEMPPGVADVLGVGPGLAIQVARVLQASGHTIKGRFEDENAAVRWFLLPFALQHGADWWPPAAATLNLMIDRAKAAVSP